MSLIEKALTKTHSTHHPPSAGAQPQVPSPGSLLGPSTRRPRIGLMAFLGGLMALGLAGGWLFLEYWPASLSPQDGKPTAREPLQGSMQDSATTQPQTPSHNGKEYPVEQQGQQLVAPNPEPHLPSAGVKGPLFDQAEERSHYNKPQQLPQAARSSEGKKENKKGAEEKKRILLEKAYIQAQAGRLQTALQIYDQVLAWEPEQLEALVNRGVLRMRMGDLAGAKRDLLEAKRLQPQDPTLLNALGVLHLEAGELDEAATYFLSSPEPASLVNLALVYWRKGSLERALELLLEAQGRNPHDPWLPYYRALLLRELGRQKQAQEELEKARGLALKRGDMELIQRLDALQAGP